MAGENQQHEHRIYGRRRDDDPYDRRDDARGCRGPALRARPCGRDTTRDAKTAQAKRADRQKEIAFRLRIGANQPAPQARLWRSRPVAEDVGRKGFHLVERTRTKAESPQLEIGKEKRQRQRRDDDRGHGEGGPHARVRPELPRGDFEERVRQHERREEKQEIAVREVLRNERGACPRRAPSCAAWSKYRRSP